MMYCSGNGWIDNEDVGNQIIAQLQWQIGQSMENPLGRNAIPLPPSMVQTVQPTQKKANGKRRSRPNHPFNSHNVRLNAKICQVSETGNVWDLLDLIGTHHNEMNVVNLSTALHRAARIAKKSNTIRALSGHPQIARLRQQVLTELQKGFDISMTLPEKAQDPGMLPRCLATIAWSYATLQFQDERLFRLIAQIATQQLWALKAFELANLLWAFAKVQHPATSLFDAAAQYIPEQFDNFTPVSLSMITWAYVTLHPKPPCSLLRRVSLVFVRDVSSAKSQEIANMCWALATAKLAKPAVFQALGMEAVRKLSTFNIQELSNTAWAFSRSGLVHVELFEAITDLFIKNPGIAFQFHGQALANMMWSLAKQVALGGGSASKLQSIAVFLMPACAQLLERFKPQEFSSMLWSVAKLGFKLGHNSEADRVFQCAASMDVTRLNQLSVRGLTNVLYAVTEFINGSPSYADFLHLLSSCMMKRFGELEVIGLLYVMESLSSLLQQRVEVPNLQKLTFLVALEVLKHKKQLNPCSIARLLSCTNGLTTEMRTTIVTIVEAHGIPMHSRKDDMERTCGAPKNAHQSDNVEIVQESARGFTEKSSTNEVRVCPQDNDRGKVLPDESSPLSPEQFQQVLALRHPPSQTPAKNDAMQDRNTGEPMWLQLPAQATPASQDSDIFLDVDAWRGSSGNQRRVALNHVSKPPRRDIQTGLAARSHLPNSHGHESMMAGDAGYRSVPNLYTGIACAGRHGDVSREPYRWMESDSTTEGMWRGLDDREESRMRNFGDSEEEDAFDNCLTEFSANMRIVTPDFLGGFWDTSRSDVNLGGSTTASLGRANETNFVGTFSRPPGEWNCGAEENPLAPQGVGMPPRCRRLRSLPLRYNRTAGQTKPMDMETNMIEESVEENRMTSSTIGDVNDSAYQARTSFGLDEGRSSFGDEGRESYGKFSSFNRPSWADEDPCDVDLTSVLELEWQEPNSFRSIERVERDDDEMFQN